ncbi:GNAT family N-acetyltransferase [Kribbella soli]|uniref:GNAT family N-acetyltransferase n=1 Tax=Kribbella soli TaxID=1124743 RepID=A0A4R0H6M2_9ACTN|nr:GNAT family N-acetyltransferase [Kribbella soli]TCC06011.1 hypothetical protein E0H45_28955 [Kribbella soli]
MVVWNLWTGGRSLTGSWSGLPGCGGGTRSRPASALLRANHAALWKSGVREASLWTVLENPTGSVALYERAGYRLVERQPRYRKPAEGR